MKYLEVGKYYFDGSIIHSYIGFAFHRINKIVGVVYKLELGFFRFTFIHTKF